MLHSESTDFYIKSKEMWKLYIKQAVPGSQGRL